MATALFTITSNLHKEIDDVRNDTFIKSVEDATGENFDIHGEDFSEYESTPDKVIYVRTGGTEGKFRELGLKGEIRILTSGKSNSLAAAMEILSYINKTGGKGEILHGSAEYIAGRLKTGLLQKPCEEWFKALPEVDFDGARIGIVGKPSDWLISSDVDYLEVQRKMGLVPVDIDIREVIGDVEKSGCRMSTIEGSEAIYDSLKKVVQKYNLAGLTIRCFDLLDTVHNTGCLALAKLNAEGIPSSCEGDIPTLLTMMLAHKLTGCPGFQCNLSRISGDELLFAHCTVPLSMVTSYKYDTHFESGIGTAIKGELPEGNVTIIKISPDLKKMVVIPAYLDHNESQVNLCRTQIIVKAPGAAEYFLSSPLANHHLIVPGHIL